MHKKANCPSQKIVMTNNIQANSCLIRRGKKNGAYGVSPSISKPTPQIAQGEDGPEKADGQRQHHHGHGQDAEQRLRDLVRRQQPTGHHGRADRKPGGQDQLHPVLVGRTAGHPHQVATY